MHGLRLICNYRDHDSRRRSFCRLAREIFGIDFTEWHARGFWDERYVCHSLADGDRIVANASTNELQLILSGDRIRAVQIGTVMTHPDYRGRGLGRRLMESVLARCRAGDTPAYVLGDREVAGFYEATGLKSKPQSSFVAGAPSGGDPDSGLRRLGRSEPDLSLIHSMALKRQPVSRLFGVLGAEHILMWYCFNVLRGCFYHAPAHDAVVVARWDNDTLHLLDVVSSRTVDFSRLISDICGRKTRRVRFHFIPDRTGLRACCREDSRGDVILAEPELLSALPQNCLHPATGQA